MNDQSGNHCLIANTSPVQPGFVPRHCGHIACPKFGRKDVTMTHVPIRHRTGAYASPRQPQVDFGRGSNPSQEALGDGWPSRLVRPWLALGGPCGTGTPFLHPRPGGAASAAACVPALDRLQGRQALGPRGESAAGGLHRRPSSGARALRLGGGHRPPPRQPAHSGVKGRALFFITPLWNALRCWMRMHCLVIDRFISSCARHRVWARCLALAPTGRRASAMVPTGKWLVETYLEHNHA